MARRSVPDAADSANSGGSIASVAARSRYGGCSKPFPGALVENKGFSFTVHYRNSAPSGELGVALRIIVKAFVDGFRSL